MKSKDRCRTNSSDPTGPPPQPVKPRSDSIAVEAASTRAAMVEVAQSQSPFAVPHVSFHSFADEDLPEGRSMHRFGMMPSLGAWTASRCFASSIHRTLASAMSAEPSPFDTGLNSSFHVPFRCHTPQACPGFAPCRAPPPKLSKAMAL